MRTSKFLQTIFIIIFISISPILNAQSWNQIGNSIYGTSFAGYLGSSISLSADGSIMAVGAPAGAYTESYVRVYKNILDTWIQIGADFGGTLNSGYGQSVSLSADGSILAIGDHVGGKGKVRIYQNILGDWIQIGSDIEGEDYGDLFGCSVSLSADGSVVAIGGILNADGGFQSGHVRVYKNISSTWTQIGQDIDAESAYELLGQSVSLSADGSVVAIGVPNKNSIGWGTGQVKVYENVSGNWTQLGQDIDGEAAGDNFGTSVSLSADGSTVASYAPNNEGDESVARGHVRVFENNMGTWTQIGNDIDKGVANGNPEGTVSLNADGSILAYGIDTLRIYQNISGVWTQMGNSIYGGNLTTSLSADGSIVACGYRNQSVYNLDGVYYTGGVGKARVFHYNTLTNSIKGNVWIDDNCILDANEQGIGGVIIKTEPNHFYGITDSLGAYTVNTGIGTYQVEQVLPPINNGFLLRPLCPEPNYHTVSFDSLAMDTTGIDFYHEIIECPFLSVDILSNRRRRCFISHTVIEYCNDGFVDATGVEVTVQFPEYVVFVSADYAHSTDAEGNYVFNIGNLLEGECGTIHIIDSVACIEDITGLTQCTEAWITPPNDCSDSLDTGFDTWDKSSVMVEGECLNDTLVRFTISNTGEYGEGDMQNPHEYRIYVDNGLVEILIFQLNGGESINIDYSANGQTVRLEADQHPEHPGNSHPQETIEACGDYNGEISTGFVNNLPMDDADFDVEIDCMEIIDSSDPNDKSVSPSGITYNHYLEAGTLLDYQIRFQNTGSDTVYTVIVVDTLSAHLNPSTIDWGLSSHPYTVDVTGVGTPTLSFTFNNIDLPDSTTNELESHGFIKFKVAPYDTLVNGTEINNTAYIYFDYTMPIVTNTAQIIISDAVQTIDLTINNNTGTDVQTACNTFDWIDGNTYTTSNNTATHSIPNTAGCDSVITLDLTINTVNTAVTVNDPDISSNATSAAYQWMDCNDDFAILVGEVNQTFTTSYNGGFAVEIEENGCVDTSACVNITTVGIEYNANYEALKIYPNPTTGKIIIQGENIQSIKIVNINGTIIKQFAASDKYVVDLSLQAKGFYFINVISQKEVIIKKIVLE